MLDNSKVTLIGLSDIPFANKKSGKINKQRDGINLLKKVFVFMKKGFSYSLAKLEKNFERA